MYAGTLGHALCPFYTANECDDLYCIFCNNQGPIGGHFSDDHRMAACSGVPREYLWKPHASQNSEQSVAIMGWLNLVLKQLVDQGIENFQILQIPKTSPEMNRLARGRVRVRRGVHSFEQRRRYRHLKTRIPLRPKSQILIESQRIAIELQIRAHLLPR